MFKKTSGPAKENPFQVQGYLVRIVQIIGLGLQSQSDWQTHEAKPSKYEVMFTFEFNEMRNDKDQPMWLSRRFSFPQSWPDKSGLKDNTNLYKLFAALAPELLTQSEKWPAYWFYDDNIFSELLGKACYANVDMTKTGKPKISSVGKVPVFGGKAVEVPALENPTLLFDAPDATLADYKAIWGWVRDVISEAEDEETAEASKALAAELKKETDERAAAMAEAPEEGKYSPGGPDEKDVNEFEDDVPF